MYNYKLGSDKQILEEKLKLKERKKTSIHVMFLLLLGMNGGVEVLSVEMIISYN